MSKTKDATTEVKILEAAKKIFIAKGLDGARMQDIANEAGINKSMLHYYYRSKDKLFQTIFKEQSLKMLQALLAVLVSDLPVLEKVIKLIEREHETLYENPVLPMFIFHEMSKEEAALPEGIEMAKIIFKQFKRQVEQEVAAGTIRPISAEDLMISVMSSSQFPFMAKPMILHVMFDDNEAAYLEWLQDRKQAAIEVAIRLLKPD